VYIVPNVPLISQKLTMACWYACAQMLVSWRREKDLATRADMWDPSEDPASVTRWTANKGLTNAEILGFAQKLGLVSEPAIMTPTPATILKWLQTYGPLWVNGVSHITVVVGIDMKKSQVRLHNPAPVNVGRKEWRPFTWLFGSSFDSMDTSTDSKVLFLHCP
jgi:hypothetical protein